MDAQGAPTQREPSYDALRARVRELEAQVAELESLNCITGGTFQELYGLRDRVKELEAEVEQKRTAYQQLDKMNAAANRAFSIYKDKCTKLEVEIRGEAEDNAEKDARIAKLEGENARMKIALRDIDRAGLCDPCKDCILTLADEEIEMAKKALGG